MTLYSGDEFYDDDVTSGPMEDPHEGFDEEGPALCEVCSDSDATEFFDAPPFDDAKTTRFCIACYESEKRRRALDREERERHAAVDHALCAWKDERTRP